MKRIFALVFILILSFSGCGNTETTETPDSPTLTTQETNTTTDPTAKKLNIVCTTFPQYDWVRQILGEDLANHELTLLLDNRVDLHSYQPSVSDIVKISTADLFIYVGGESDEWTEDVLKNVQNPNMVALSLVEILGEGVKIEESVKFAEEHDHGHEEDGHEDEDNHDHDEDGHEDEDDHGHDEDGHEDEDEDDHDHDEDGHEDEDDHGHDEEEHEDEDEDDHGHDEDGHEDEDNHGHDEDGHDDDHDTHSHAHDDEHVWLSLKNAQLFSYAITNALSALNADNSALYETNLTAYLGQLAALDMAYRTALDGVPIRTLLFAGRFPFRYLVDDYGLSYYAAFSGCSAETEASFATIASLAAKVNELGLHTVMLTESCDKAIANTVINSTTAKNQQILVLDAMQSVTTADVNNGATYLSIMENNLRVLAEALR
ncbi:MAG: metal ABC transporter substrate-binding protein [Defluviitaleaceae bacterium]|nr:metal ABC transporter substrate-binding protein [Defluviitaleaceae bacterium]